MIWINGKQITPSNINKAWFNGVLVYSKYYHGTLYKTGGNGLKIDLRKIDPKGTFTLDNKDTYSNSELLNMKPVSSDYDYALKTLTSIYYTTWYYYITLEDFHSYPIVRLALKHGNYAGNNVPSDLGNITFN